MVWETVADSVEEQMKGASGGNDPTGLARLAFVAWGMSPRMVDTVASFI